MNSTGGLLAAFVFCNLAAMPAAADPNGTTASAPQQPINLSKAEAARSIVVRNDPNTQEHVILDAPRGDASVWKGLRRRLATSGPR
jgi:hypothetical protein